MGYLTFNCTANRVSDEVHQAGHSMDKAVTSGAVKGGLCEPVSRSCVASVPGHCTPNRSRTARSASRYDGRRPLKVADESACTAALPLSVPMMRGSTFSIAARSTSPCKERVTWVLQQAHRKEPEAGLDAAHEGLPATVHHRCRLVVGEQRLEHGTQRADAYDGQEHARLQDISTNARGPHLSTQLMLFGR